MCYRRISPIVGLPAVLECYETFDKAARLECTTYTVGNHVKKYILQDASSVFPLFQPLAAVERDNCTRSFPNFELEGFIAHNRVCDFISN